MNQITIATWNLQTDKELTQGKTDAFRLEMDKINADVWVITEPLLRFSPGAAYRLVAHSCEASDIEKGTDEKWRADRRWVAIWSKLPARRIEVLREPDRMACIRIEQNGLRDVVIVGTVLPWTSDPKWRGKDGKGFCDALEYQAVEWKRLWGTPQVAGFCVVGDFNQSVPYTPHYGPPPGATMLQQVLASLGLDCLTGNSKDPLPAFAQQPSIDHICVSGNLQPLAPSVTWKRPSKTNSADPMTDHYGAWAKLSVLQ